MGITQGTHGHIPVMCSRMVELVLEGVQHVSGPAIVVDGTLGAGGHTEAFLEENPHVTVVGLDRDPYALEQASERLAQYGSRFIPVRTRFDSFSDSLLDLNETGKLPVNIAQQGISGFLFDLGVSSMQLDQAERGFAYSVDAPLDMRMDPSLTITAADILNTYSHGELARILKKYGDERFAGKIASAVLQRRETQPFIHSAELVELLYRVIPAASRRTGGHPAKRTFQALRVEVNSELEALENVVEEAASWLHPGAQGAFMSYQSLEDKIVKDCLRVLTSSKTPAGLPIEIPELDAHFNLVTKGAEKATPQEIEENPRAHPVRVRALVRKETPPVTSYPQI